MIFKSTNSLLLFLVCCSCVVEMHEASEGKSCADVFGPNFRCVRAVNCAEVYSNPKFVGSTCGSNDEGVCCPKIDFHSPPKSGIRRQYMRKRSTQDSNKETNLKDIEFAKVKTTTLYTPSKLNNLNIQVVSKSPFKENSKKHLRFSTMSYYPLTKKIGDPSVSSTTELSSLKYDTATESFLKENNSIASRTTNLTPTNTLHNLPTTVELKYLKSDTDVVQPSNNIMYRKPSRNFMNPKILEYTIFRPNFKYTESSNVNTTIYPLPLTTSDLTRNEKVSNPLFSTSIQLNNDQMSTFRPDTKHSDSYQNSLDTVNTEDLTQSKNITPPDILISASPLYALSSSSYTHNITSNVFDSNTLLYLPYTRKWNTKVVQDKIPSKINQSVLLHSYHTQNSMTDLLKYTTGELLISPNTPLGDENKLKKLDFRKKEIKKTSESETSSPETITKLFNKTTSLKTTTKIFAKAMGRKILDLFTQTINPETGKKIFTKTNSKMSKLSSTEQNKEYSDSSNVLITERAILSTATGTEKIQSISTSAMPLINAIPLTKAMALTKTMPLTKAMPFRKAMEMPLIKEMPLISDSSFKIQSNDEFEKTSSTSALITKIKPKVMLQTTPIPTSIKPRRIIEMKIFPAKKIQDKENVSNVKDFRPFTVNPHLLQKSLYKDPKILRDKIFRKGKYLISHLSKNVNVYARAHDHEYHDSQEFDFLSAEETARHFRSETGKHTDIMDSQHDIFLKYRNPNYLCGLGLEHDH